MIDFLSILADFGLIREDYKHNKRVDKKERRYGKKRPVERHLFRPSIIIIFVVLIISTVGIIRIASYQKTTVLPDTTKKEIAKISAGLEKWHEHYHEYPATLELLIANNPIRKSWLRDAWQQEYTYEITATGFLITSAGSDRNFGTADDITSE